MAVLNFKVEWSIKVRFIQLQFQGKKNRHSLNIFKIKTSKFECNLNDIRIEKIILVPISTTNFLVGFSSTRC